MRIAEPVLPAGPEGVVAVLPAGGPVWQWGTDPSIPPPPLPYGPAVWGTVIGGDYPNDSGDGLLSPPVEVQVGVNDLIELVHYVDVETNYDGGNVVVIDQGGGETVLVPIGGYPATISTSTSFYAYCVDMEPGFTGHVNAWTTECGDLTPWDGQTIQIRLDFGTDSSVTYPGWYLAAIRFGTDEPVAVEHSTWGQIKNTYR